jgi:hypothetical protein
MGTSSPRQRTAKPRSRESSKPVAFAAAMPRAATLALAVIGLVGCPLRSWAASAADIQGQDQGYTITKTDASQNAPPGYEGRTETATRTAVGNTPATAGKTIVSRFTLGNLIKTCPNADGTAEGTGVFSIIQDRTDSQAGGIGKVHIEMNATAKYKGQVADDAHLHDPVKADIDYTYTQSGTFRAQSHGPITSPSGSNVSQHITITFTVGSNGAAPDFGDFAGGDAEQAHLSDAFAVGTALTYWAGVYYAVAQVKWMGGESAPGGLPIRAGQCVQVAFSPPSNTLQPVLGGQAKVNAQLKTKTGEVVKAQFLGAHARTGAGLVQPEGGTSDVGSPMKFTYTAPNQKVKNAGFTVYAISRAGIGEGEWQTGLGTDWSGEITYALNEQAHPPETEMGGYSTQEAMQFTVTLKDGVGSATSFASKTVNSISRQKALRGGALTLITIGSETANGAADGSSAATVQVKIDKNGGTYSILPTWTPATGKLHDVVCNHGTCETSDNPYYATPTMATGIDGKLGDLNHLSGSTTQRTSLGSGTGERTWTVTWDLARTGTN